MIQSQPLIVSSTIAYADAVPHFVLGLLAVSASGCLVALDADGPNCSAQGDCGSAVGEVRLCDNGRCVPKSAVQWGCAIEPEFNGIGEITLTVTVLQQDAGEDATPVSDLTFRICSFVDPMCLGGQEFTTDFEGRAQARVIRRLPNFIELVHPSPDYAPQLVQVGPYGDQSQKRADVVATFRRWSELPFPNPPLNALMQDRAHLYVHLGGCPGWNSAGATVALPDFSHGFEGPFYGLGSGISATASETNERGVAAFFNLDLPSAGVRTFDQVRATEVRTGLALAESPATLRRGWISEVHIDPLSNIPPP